MVIHKKRSDGPRINPSFLKALQFIANVYFRKTLTMKNTKQNNRSKPNNNQPDDTDAKIRSLLRYVDYLYYRDPIGTVVGIGLIILTAPIWYPISLLIKYRQLIIVSIIMLTLIYIPIKVYDHYIEEPKREAVLIKAKEVKDKASH